MSNTELSKQNGLPKLADLYNIENIEQSFASDQFNFLMNQKPEEKWIQVNTYANNSKYIPIGIIETLLQKIFKDHKIEILREGVMFNAVYCVVRVHLLHPVTNEWIYYDGTGAQQIQTKAGASPAQLEQINNNAVQMALPASKAYAIKDACDHIGKLFGRDLNRKETLGLSLDTGLEVKAMSKETERKFMLIENAKTLVQLDKDCKAFSKESVELSEAYRIKRDELSLIDQTAG